MSSDDQKRDEVLKRLLETPPQPKIPKERSTTQRPFEDYLIIDGKMRVAVVKSQNGASITADLYRNLEDRRSGIAMEADVKLRR